MPIDIAGFLAQVPMFAELHERSLHEITLRISTTALSGGKWLFRKGDAGDAMYIVESGALEVVDEGSGEGRLRELVMGRAEKLPSLAETIILCA